MRRICTGYELGANPDSTVTLDFDTGTADDRTDDTYYNSGAGWTPIGTAALPWNGTFHGNAQTIANLHLNRTAADTGLFGVLGSTGKLTGFVLTEVNITATAADTGALVGDNRGTITAAGVTGTVAGRNNTGAVAGVSTGSITAAYSKATVTGAAGVGGIVGATGGTVTAAYSLGSTTGTGNNVGGIAGSATAAVTAAWSISAVSGGSGIGSILGNAGTGGSVTNSYYDRETAGHAAGAGGTSQLRRALQEPTAYGSSGIYAAWNLNLDGVAGADDPWHFGNADQFPVLKYGDLNAATQLALQPALSANAALANLAVAGSPSNLALSPAFAAATTAYTLTPDPTGAWITINPRPAISVADVAITPADQRPNVAGHQINLTGGSNRMVTVTITAQDASATASYTITYSVTGADYDANDNGLIDVTTLRQLNAIRYDLDGNGIVDDEPAGVAAGSYATGYAAGYGAPVPGMGCPVYPTPAAPAAVTGKALVISASRLYAHEGGASASYTVKLNQAPTADTAFSVTGSAGSGLTFSADDATFSSTLTLTFTTTNFGTAQTVYVKAAKDADTADGSASIAHAGTTGDADYTALAAASLPVTTKETPNGCLGYELRNALDFDTGVKGDRTDDTYYNAGRGWAPIAGGVSSISELPISRQFSAIFNGNGYPISNLHIDVVGRNHPNQSYVGLFGYLYRSSRVEQVAIVNPNIRAYSYAGALAGYSEGDITASYVQGGAVHARGLLGGLVGLNDGDITACYADTRVGGIRSLNSLSSIQLGGLVASNPGTITASYAIGPVTSVITGSLRGTLRGLTAGDFLQNDSVMTYSYWDTIRSRQSETFTHDTDTGNAGYLTYQLRNPTAYGATVTDIYPADHWNLNLDGVTGADDPWHFGTNAQYPALKYGSHSASAQFARQPVISNDSTLSALTLTPATLDTAFAAGTTTYTASIATDDGVITVAPTTASAAARTASISITPVDHPDEEATTDDVDAKTAGHQVILHSGANAIAIKVTAEDGGAQTYNISLTASALSYDPDQDGLINITTLRQLDAVRYDLNGDGVVHHHTHDELGGPVFASDDDAYHRAFPRSPEGMGCPAYPAPAAAASVTGAAVKLSVGSLYALEGGDSLSYQVSLNAAPSGPVTVTITPAATALTVSADDATFAASVVLNFTATNYSTPQTVYVKAAADDNVFNGSVAIVHDPAGSDYAAVANASLPVTTTETAGQCQGYELLNDLDFDTDGDGSSYTRSGSFNATCDSDDAYCSWTRPRDGVVFSQHGWEPLGHDSHYALANADDFRYNAIFNGNGHTIDNLYAQSSDNDKGLFGAVGTQGVIEALGIRNAYVYGGTWTGIVVGSNYGTLRAVYTTGFVTGTQDVGALTGYSNGSITASYSRADVLMSNTISGATQYAGGLTGEIGSGGITASYAAGAITAPAGTYGGGLVGNRGSVNPTIANAYWDTITTGAAVSTAGGAGKKTYELRNPTGYTGIYDNWNLDVDGDATTSATGYTGGLDDPGTSAPPTSTPSSNTAATTSPSSWPTSPPSPPTTP